MDCTFRRKATKKHASMQKYLMEKPVSLRFPTTKRADLSLLPFVISTAMSELSMIAVDAKRVDAIMLFLNVCTESTPFFDVSYVNRWTKVRDFACMSNHIRIISNIRIIY